MKMGTERPSELDPEPQLVDGEQRSLARSVLNEPPHIQKPNLSPLMIAGLLSLLGYCTFWVLMQSETLWSRPLELPGGDRGIFGQIRRLFPQDWLQARVGSSLGAANIYIYIGLLVFLFLFYWRALRVGFRMEASFSAPGENRVLWPVLGISGLILLVLLFVPGVMSADLHSYIWYGRIFYDYGANPFVHAPLEFASRDTGQWLNLVYWKDVPSVYGPVWVWLAGGIAWLASLFGGDISLSLLGHKLLADVAHLVNIVILWHVTGLVIKRYFPALSASSQPEQQDRHLYSRLGVTLFYAWNPLLMIEIGANGHNDVLVVTCILVGLWLYLSGHWRVAASALALACLIKATALLVWPGFLWLLLWQPQGEVVPKRVPDSTQGGKTLPGEKPDWHKTGQVVQAIGIALATWVVCYIPFWESIKTLQPLTGGPASRLFINSLASLVRFNGGEWLHGLALAHGWSTLAGSTIESTRVVIEVWIRWLAWGATIALAIPHVWRGRTVVGMLSGWGWLLFFYLTIGALWFWPWYVSWLIVPAALAGPGRLMKATAILCFTSLLVYAVYPALPVALGGLLYWRALFVIAPALFYVGVSGLIARMRVTRSRVKPAA